MKESLFSITNTTRYKKPRVPFLVLKNKILGKNYRLSVVLTDSKISKDLNKKYRKKNKPTNVLSFSLSKKEGEIFLDLQTISKEQEKFGRKIDNLTAFLFIHGLFHLKGFDHGVTMERKEAALRKKMGI